ncbi:MAG: hypothetical protein IPK10_11555 [Bacteroidetes bacterium]|nr:hypothetical protein [Bacteroidota bacterium]
MNSKTYKSIFLWLVLSLPLFDLSAQALLQFSPQEKPSFKQMQRDFAAWKDTNNLQESKNWKFIKRWESDMQMHTDAQGEPTGLHEYTKLLIESAENSSSQERVGVSNFWLPFGPYQLPTNLTGYMQNGMGRVNCIEFDPINPSIFYVGVARRVMEDH